MPLIDSNIFNRNPGPSYLGAALQGYDQGMQANDARRQRQAQIEQQQREAQARPRQQAFEQNARGLLSSYGPYAYTPEGRRGLLNDLSKAGFGPEAMGLFGQMEGVMPPQPKQQEYQFKEFGDQAVTFNPATGKAEAIPGMQKAEKPKDPQKVWADLSGAASPTLYNQVTGETKKTGIPGKPRDTASPDGLTPYQRAMLKFNEDKAARESKKALEDRIVSWRKETDESRRGAVAITAVDKSLKGMGLKDGIYGGGEGIEGYGVGGKLFRNLPRGKALADLRSAVAELTIAYRKENFGTAQSAGELRAMDEFVGQGTVSDEASFLAGMQRINAALDQKLRPESEDLAKALEGRKILYHKNLPQAPGPAKKAVTEADIDNMSAEELKAFLEGQ